MTAVPVTLSANKFWVLLAGEMPGEGWQQGPPWAILQGEMLWEARWEGDSAIPAAP
ncbi:hypothetical protein Nmel_013419, partial [Mimus melanotis]